MKNCILVCFLCLFFLGMGNSIDATASSRQSVENNSTIVLYPQDADLTYAANVIIEPQSPPYNLGGWKGDAIVVFPVHIEQAGSYAISAVYSRNADFIANVQIVASQSLKHDVLASSYLYEHLPPTGYDWTNYRTIQWGVMQLSQGTNYIIISDWDEISDFYLMNLRELRLVRQ